MIGVKANAKSNPFTSFTFTWEDDIQKSLFQKNDVRTACQEFGSNGKNKFTYTSALLYYLDKLNLTVGDNQPIDE